MPFDCASASTDFFTTKAKPICYQRDSRYGIVISKKIFKLAIERSRAKRLLRDWIAYNENLMQEGYDYIFIAKINILNTDRETGRTTVKNALEKIQTLIK
ncbi:MAG: ribonuclease P protein component [Alphaproteobacteria bacterium]|nr:ribonuclease P protein component [Alphaproteobacteria bacterium]